MDLIFFDTPMGRMGLGGSGDTITALYLPLHEMPPASGRETPVFAEAKRQLLEYLTGARRVFDLPLAPEGTAFQREVWRALEAIPYGETRTYRDIAAAIGRPKAVRAVGQANHRNPISIFIPCHRVVGADGSLTGYGGGLELKETLLKLEQGRESGRERS